jgi:branched-chain amino acid transport system ATP-binding protein
MPLLEVEDLRAGYGPVPVLHGVSLSIEEGETAVMLGLNGAGKSTTMLSIAGLLRPWSGRVVFDGEPVHKEDCRELVRRGIVLVPEGRHVFPGLSVLNNLKLGAWVRRKDVRVLMENLEFAFSVFPLLADRNEAARRINAEGVTVLMVEQNASALRIADRAFVMDKGRIVKEGSGQELLAQGELRTTHLGAPA